MNIKAFNTGAKYSPQGQRIAYAQLCRIDSEYALVAMVDVDRQLDYVLRVEAYRGPITDQKVHEAYLNCRYERDCWLDAETKAALTAAAIAQQPLNSTYEFRFGAWRIRGYGDDYLYADRPGLLGEVHIKSEAGGYVVDIWSGGADPEVMSTCWAAYADLEG